jgi:myo-inositol-1(or 4)-monophosphatase
MPPFMDATSNAVLEQALPFARTLAHETAQSLKATFGKLNAAQKKDGSLVTASDLESDRRLSVAIHTRFPTHGILSEEQDRVFHGQEWCWVIDPIDGTTNFKWGLPLWGVLIGLLHHGEPVLGIADFPMTGEHYWSAVGHGAWRNENQIHAATVAHLDKTQIFAACTRTLKLGHPAVPPKVRVGGSAGYDFATVANGVCVGALQLSVHLWDIAALWPLLGEAGAVIVHNYANGLFPLATGLDHGDITFGVLAACSAEILQALHHGLGDRLAAH